MFTFSIPSDRIRAPMTSLAEKKKQLKSLLRLQLGHRSAVSGCILLLSTEWVVLFKGRLPRAHAENNCSHLEGKSFSVDFYREQFSCW